MFPLHVAGDGRGTMGCVQDTELRNGRVMYLHCDDAGRAYEAAKNADVRLPSGGRLHRVGVTAGSAALLQGWACREV